LPCEQTAGLVRNNSRLLVRLDLSNRPFSYS
jgi:hypothetical protein